MFAVPWRDYILIGVWHKVYPAPPEDIIVEPEEIESFVREVNQAYPGLSVRLDEITLINTGLTLFGEEGQQDPERISFGKRSMLIDHDSVHGLKGLVTLIGVRATTARGMACKAIDLAVRKIGNPAKRSDTETTPIYGGDIDSFDRTVQAILSKFGEDLSTAQACHLVANYGSQWPEVLKYTDRDPSLIISVENSKTSKAEILHAVREEMAVHLTDVVFRRTDLGTGRFPFISELKICAQSMAGELGWDQQTIDTEIQSVANTFHTLNSSSN